MPLGAPRSALPLLPMALAAAAGAAILAMAPPHAALLAALAGAVFFFAFLNAEVAVHLIILSMLLSPEAVIRGGGLEFGKPALKGAQAVFRFEDLLLVTVGLSWLGRTALHKELGLFRRTPLNKPIAAYALANILATAVGIFQGYVRPAPGFFFTLKYLEYFVLYFIIVNNLRDERQLRRFLVTGIATCAIASAMGILQISSGERVAAPFEGTFGEPNTFGGYLVFMLALVLALWVQSRTARAFYGWLAMAALIFLPLLFTLSRASWLGAIAMVLMLTALTERKGLIAIPVVIALIGGPILFPRQVQERIAYTFSPPPSDVGKVQIGNTRLDSSTSARLESFRHGLEGWAERPILGYGVTGFYFMDAQYVRTLTETGIVGLAAFLWLVSAVFRAAWSSFRATTHPFYRALAMGYLAGFVALLVHGIGANTFIIVRIMEPFWFFTAIVVMLPHLVAAPPAEPAVAPAPATPRAPVGRPLPRLR